jgi:hypothetical protein
MNVNSNQEVAQNYLYGFTALGLVFWFLVRNLARDAKHLALKVWYTCDKL